MSTLKYLSNFDQLKTEEPIVESIKHLPYKIQAELIIERLAKAGNLFEPLQPSDVKSPKFSESDIPQVSQLKVRQCLKKLKTNEATVKDDVPAKIILQMN